MNIKRYILLKRAGLSAEALYYAEHLGGARISDEKLKEMIKERRYKFFLKIKSKFFKNKKRKNNSVRETVSQEKSYIKRIKSLQGDKNWREVFAKKFLGIDVESYRSEIKNIKDSWGVDIQKAAKLQNRLNDLYKKLYEENVEVYNKVTDTNADPKKDTSDVYTVKGGEKVKKPVIKPGFVAVPEYESPFC